MNFLISKLTKYVATVLCLQCIVLHGLCQDNAHVSIVDQSLSKAKELSMYATLVNWDSLESAVHRKAENAQSIEALKPAFETLINGLNDHHGTVRNMKDYSILAHFTDWGNAQYRDERNFDKETRAIVNAPDARFESSILPGNVGYLKIVGVGPNMDQQKEAERIRKDVLDISRSNVQNWIVDLRYNGGGNVNVMLAGIAPLFDQRKIASVQDLDGVELGVAEIVEGNFWYFENTAFELPNDPPLSNHRIAILTSRWTVSSGELVAISFKGQKNTRFFGESTGGYTTNNSFEIIDNTIALVISTGVFCDRNGKMYLDNLQPDVEIPFVNVSTPENDNAVVAAINWLEQK